LRWVRNLFGRRDEATLPLYEAIVARAREPHWYVEGRVPDTVDGRFDAVAAVLSAVLIRMEDEPAGAEPAARLAERFVDDMDGQLRQIGIGDIVVGRHIGKMMSMLGGRLGAYRAGLAGGDLDGALVRNLYRGETPPAAALAHVAAALRELHARVRATPIDRLVAGDLP
jgi:cytochrome b pre-mRNA-processing protein 3